MKTIHIENVCTDYGQNNVLRNITLHLPTAKTIAVIGPNGAGKSTLLKVIAGLLRPTSGAIFFDDENVTHWSAAQRAVSDGLAFVMQGGRVFPSLSVRENLELGGSLLTKAELPERIDENLDLFPILRNLYNQRAGLLSGGERQMLAIATQLIREPSWLILDEPTAGLSSNMVESIFNTLTEINSLRGISILLVEQNITAALQIAHQSIALRNGKVIAESSIPRNWINSSKLEEIFAQQDYEPVARHPLTSETANRNVIFNPVYPEYA